MDCSGAGLCPPRRPHNVQQCVPPETKAPRRGVLAAAALEPQNPKLAHPRRKRRGERYLAAAALKTQQIPDFHPRQTCRSEVSLPPRRSRPIISQNPIRGKSAAALRTDLMLFCIFKFRFRGYFGDFYS